MNKKALSLAICLAMALPTVSNALSLGDIESNSSLNQPFKGKIQLLSTSVAEAKTLRIRVAPAAVFNRVGIDRPAFLNSIRFRTTIQNGRPVILVSSSQAINEPFLNFLLEVSWPNGQLLKEYTVLLDPPVLIRPDTAIASNAAGVRAEPRAQGRITRPVAQQRRVTQQPRRVVRAAAAPRRTPARQGTAASQARNYRVISGDTLSKVAKKLGYSGIKNEQMMMALFEKNRRAFSKRNINNLKAGALLKRPSLQEARAIGSKKARSQIVAQAREWKKARAEQVAKNAANKNTGTAKTPQQARLEVVGNSDSVKGNSSQGNSVASAELNKKLTLANESLTTRLKENEELKSRVTELESLLRKKNRLITLKSQQLAQLQGSMSGETPETTGENPEVITDPVEAVVPTPEVSEVLATAERQEAIVDVGGDIQQQVANDLANEQGQIIREEQIEIAPPEPVIEEPVIAEAAESPFKQKEESFDIMGLLGSPAAMAIGGGSSLLALLGVAFYMRRRNSTDDNEYEEFSSIDIDNGMDDTPFDESSFVNEINEEDYVKHDEIQQEVLMTEDENVLVDEGEQEDILQEADVYIVYGLHDQAESELKQAIEKDPGNLAYRAKLIENYKAAGDKVSFEEEVKEFMTIESEGKDEYLEEITEWGNSLIPESKLFSGDSLVAGAAATGVAMVAGNALATEESDSDVGEFIDVEVDLHETPKVSDDFSLDEDLENFNLDDVLSDSDEELVLGEAAKKDDFGSDFEQDADAIKVDLTEDFNLDIDEQFLENASSDMEDESSESILEETVDDTFAVNLDDITYQEESINLDSSLEAANLNLDIDSEELSKIMPEDNAYTNTKDGKDTEDSSLSEFDFDDVEADLEETVLAKLDDKKLDVAKLDAEENLLAEFDDNLSFLDLDDEDEVIEETQVETRLDLAKAYIDMGDIEGARSTLEEVMQDGSDDQKRQAEELLHQTG